MAQSVRISDELYEQGNRVSESLSRSIAQQLEHWARLGMALDAAGVTSAQVLELLEARAPEKAAVLRELGLVDVPAGRARQLSAGRTARRRDIAKRIAEHLDAERRAVQSGQKSQEELFLFPRAAVKGAKVRFSEETLREGEGW